MSRLRSFFCSRSASAAWALTAVLATFLGTVLDVRHLATGAHSPGAVERTAIHPEAPEHLDSGGERATVDCPDCARTGRAPERALDDSVESVLPPDRPLLLVAGDPGSPRTASIRPSRGRAPPRR